MIGVSPIDPVFHPLSRKLFFGPSIFIVSSFTAKCFPFSLSNTNQLPSPCHPVSQRSLPPTLLSSALIRCSALTFVFQSSLSYGLDFLSCTHFSSPPSEDQVSHLHPGILLFPLSKLQHLKAHAPPSPPNHTNHP